MTCRRPNTPAQQREYQRLYAQRQSVSSSAGNAAAYAAYGGLGELKQEVRQVRAQLQRMERADKKNSEDNARQTGSAVRGGIDRIAADANRRRPLNYRLS